MREVAVIGVSMIKFGRYPDKDVSQLGAQAGHEALKDAGVQMKDIESLYSGNLYATSGSGQRILQQMGQTGICDRRICSQVQLLQAGHLSNKSQA